MVSAIVAYCELNRLPVPVPEHRFHDKRKWRFDYGWLDLKLALEVQGGLFIQGRHSRGAALLKEHEKLNAAALLGWRVMYCTPDDVKTGRVFRLLDEALKNGRTVRSA